VKETDLWVGAETDLTNETRDLIFSCRYQIENYINTYPEFATSLSPFPEDSYAPSIVKEMIFAGGKVGIGPMASIAGAIAQYVGNGLLEFSDQVIVENGGDIFLKTGRPATISVLAGDSVLSEKFGLLIHERMMPLGICSSSGTVGHSLSMGIANLICLLSPSASLADSAATAIGNKIKKKSDLEKVAGWVNEIDGIIGGLAIVEEKMATWGDLELVAL
jgi:ApbE superfamily uncharacterized protein (UPF0280 family)